MLVTITEDVEKNPRLMEWIGDINRDYMEKFGMFGPSLGHYRLSDAQTVGMPLSGPTRRPPFNFALIFPGSQESVGYLADAIERRAKGDVGILTMQAEDLPTRRSV
jgi:hypothetical protein